MRQQVKETVETATLFRREAEQTRAELSDLQGAMEEVTRTILMKCYQSLGYVRFQTLSYILFFAFTLTGNLFKVTDRATAPYCGATCVNAPRQGKAACRETLEC